MPEYARAGHRCHAERPRIVLAIAQHGRSRVIAALACRLWDTLPQAALPKRRIPPKNHVAPSTQSAHDEMMRDLTRRLGQQEFGSLDEVNAFLQREVTGKVLRHVEPATDRERVEDLVTSAREQRSLPRLRAQVAKALVLDADCVSAQLLLAEVAESPPTALAHCRYGIAAGDRVLSAELSQVADDGAPSVWYHPIGRQTCMFGTCTPSCSGIPATSRRPDEARTILRVNAGDNQGLRYTLLAWLMGAGSVADIEALLAAHDEQTAAWMFSAALHEYRTRGPAPEATKALRAAMRANAHVVPMLLGETKLLEELPDSYSIGGQDEAMLCHHSSAAA